MTSDATNTERLSPPKRLGGPLGWLLNLFSSIWLGVFLLAALFVYSAIGSSGLPLNPEVLKPPFILRPEAWLSIRQLRWFELTEFEWFHWWPFDLLIALICTNLVVATLRRIPFKPINYGVWMIHTGIIVLSLGSVWYFSTKVEGLTPVLRREIVINVPGAEPKLLPAISGSRAAVQTEDETYLFEVRSIDPNWTLLTEDRKGETAYSVLVTVMKGDEFFFRRLLTGHPDLTEDVIRSDDPQQPMTRAIKAIGRKLVDESLEMSLQYHPQEHFYLADSAALYVREIKESKPGPWSQRPIEDLPHYNDTIADRDSVWPARPGTEDPTRLSPAQRELNDAVRQPLGIKLEPEDSDDPLDATLTVRSYVKHAQFQTRTFEGGDSLDPQLSLVIQTPDVPAQQFEFAAFDPARASGLRGQLEFVWADSVEERQQLLSPRLPILRIELPLEGKQIETPIFTTSSLDSSLPFTPIDGTAYAYRVRSLQNDLIIGEESVSIAEVEIKRGKQAFLRWAQEDPLKALDMPLDGTDMSHESKLPVDQNIVMSYVPARLPAQYTFIGGPAEDELHLANLRSEPAEVISLDVGKPFMLYEKNNVQAMVSQFIARPRPETRPWRIPRAQRDHRIRRDQSFIAVQVPIGEGIAQSVWLPYHRVVFDHPNEVIRRFKLSPTRITMTDGRAFELLYSQQRMRLTNPVALDDFKVASHIGGFSGDTSSILDWISMVSFSGEDGWTEPKEVHMNNPKEHEGFWYYQAEWDPPSGPRFEGDTPSAGLNYTVLGVGNRQGVNVQLLGCCIAVMGMIYAFYVKPIIRRRQLQGAYAKARIRESGTFETPDGRNSRHNAPIEAGLPSEVTSS